MDLESTVKVLEGLVHITVLIFFAAAVWGLWKLTENKRANLKVTVINNLRQPVKVRCPGHVKESLYEYIDNDDSDWETMQRKGIREFMFRGSLFGTPTIWCHVALDSERPTKRFRIYKSGDQKEDEIVCRLTTDGAYVDDVLRPDSWENELQEFQWSSMQPFITEINSNESGVMPDPHRRKDEVVRLHIDHDKGASVSLLGQTAWVQLRCNDGKTVAVHLESALFDMATKLAAKISVSKEASEVPSIRAQKLPSSSKRRDVFLRMVNSDTLDLVVQWCEKYKGDADYDSRSLAWEALPPWERSFLASRSMDQLSDIVQAAAYLELDRLARTAMVGIVKQYMEGKSFLDARGKSDGLGNDVEATDSEEPSTSHKHLRKDDPETFTSALNASSKVSTDCQGQVSTYRCGECNYTARTGGQLAKHALRDHCQNPQGEISEDCSTEVNDHKQEEALRPGITLTGIDEDDSNAANAYMQNEASSAGSSSSVQKD